MIESWWPSVEQIMLASTDSKARVVGLLSPDSGAGVSVLSRMLASSFGRAGIKTLVIDLSDLPADEEGGPKPWMPGNIPAGTIRTEPDGYDMLPGPVAGEARLLFNNVDALRTMLVDELADYKTVVIDLAPVLGPRLDLVNPIAVARACDAVVMVCLAGRTTEQRIKEAVSALGTAGVQISGSVMNDLHNPPLWSR